MIWLQITIILEVYALNVNYTKIAINKNIENMNIPIINPICWSTDSVLTTEAY